MELVDLCEHILWLEDLIVWDDLRDPFALIGSETDIEQILLNVNKIPWDPGIFQELNGFILIGLEQTLNLFLSLLHKHLKPIPELFEIHMNNLLLLDSQHLILIGLQLKDIRINFLTDSLIKSFIGLGGLVEDGQELLAMEVGLTQKTQDAVLAFGVEADALDGVAVL